MISESFNREMDKVMKRTDLPLIKDNFGLFLDEIIDTIYKTADEYEIDGLKFAFNYKGNIQSFRIKINKSKTNGKTSTITKKKASNGSEAKET